MVCFVVTGMLKEITFRMYTGRYALYLLELINAAFLSFRLSVSGCPCDGQDVEKEFYAI
jgi:hypothetical protein